MDGLKRTFAPRYKKHNWFHRHNIFNFALRNHLRNTLGATPPTTNTYTSPVLDQGQFPYCLEYCSVAVRAATTGKTYDPMLFLHNVLYYTKQSISEYQGTDLQTGMAVGVSPGFGDGTTASAVLWIYPESGQSFCAAINENIQLYKRPASLAGTWFDEFFNSQGGVITAGAQTIDGGHAMMLCGIGTDGYMLNQGSWGSEAPGSMNGYYRFSSQVFDSYYTGYGCAIWIDSSDRTVQILGKLSAMYVMLVDLLSS